MTNINEQSAARAFSQQALVFDEYDAGNTVIAYKRRRVRDHVLRYLPPQGSILELNAGTGEDAIFFAGQGYRVHATDIAQGMQDALWQKTSLHGLTDKISRELCSFTDLANLQHRGPYDLIFSNFAGLNCTDELEKVLRSFSTQLCQVPGCLQHLECIPSLYGIQGGPCNKYYLHIPIFCVKKIRVVLRRMRMSIVRLALRT